MIIFVRNLNMITLLSWMYCSVFACCLFYTTFGRPIADDYIKYVTLKYYYYG